MAEDDLQFKCFRIVCFPLLSPPAQSYPSNKSSNVDLQGLADQLILHNYVGIWPKCMLAKCLWIVGPAKLYVTGLRCTSACDV